MSGMEKNEGGYERMEQTRVMHEFAPVYDCRSRILILGTIKIRQGTDWENTFQDSGPRVIGEPCCPGAKLRP